MVTTSTAAILRGDDAAAPAAWPPTLSAALLRAGRARGKGVINIDAEGRERTASYAELIAATGPARAALRGAGAARADPVVLAVRDNWRFLTTFWACVLDGYVPTPIAPPASSNPDDAGNRRLASVCTLLGGPLVVVDEEQSCLVPGARYLDLRGVAVGPVGAAPPGDIADTQPGDIAVNLLTSGSTGIPKCVPLTNHAVAHRSWAAARHCGLGPGEVALNWMPLDHVGGLIMWCVQSAFLGCDYVNVATRRIVAAPLTWLDLLTRFHVTMTWAPNFAFGLINSELATAGARAWDLRALRHLMNAGEAVIGATSQEFLLRLASYGLRPDALDPAWGMSETTSAVVYSCLDGADKTVGMLHVDPGSLDGELGFVPAGQPRAMPFTVTGEPIAGVAVRIVGEDGRVLPQDRIGDLQVTGETLLDQYAGNEEANRSAFTDDGWFRTGDRGFIHDGALTVVGRGDDAIVVNGVNVPGHEIEAAIAAIEEIRPGFVAAASVRTHDGQQKVVIFVTLRADHGHLREPVRKRVRAVVARDFGFTPGDVVILPERSFHRTAIGKIQRKRIAAEYVQKTDPVSRVFAQTWDKSPPSPSAGVEAMGTFLVFGEAGSPQARASQDILVSRGPAFRELGPRRFEIDPDDAGSYAALYASLEQRGLHPAVAVYHWLPGPDFDLGPVPGTDVFDRGGPASLLVMLQASARMETRFAQLFVVTRNACAIRPDDQANPFASIVSGLILTARSEGIGIDIRQVDFGPKETFTEILATLRAEAGVADGEAVVGYRDGARHRRRAVPARPAGPAPAPVLRTGGTALITGGLGDVGYELARYLQDRYKMSLVLAGRTPAHIGGNGTRSSRLTALAGRGRVQYLCCDASDEQAVEQGVADVEARWGTAVNVVLHLASENVGDNWRRPEQHLLPSEPVATFRTVMRSKFLSAWAVTRLAARRPSCALVLFSSLNGFVGASPFGSYAAACTGTDAIGRHAAQAGIGPVRCLAWSIWSGLGMSRAAGELNLAAHRRGYQIMTRDEALEVLEIAIGVDEPYLLLGFDPAPEADAQEAEMAGPVATEAGQPAVTSPDGAARPRSPWERTVAAVWSRVLGADVAEIDTNFFSLGGSSIMAIRSAAMLAEEFSARIQVADLYENPTVRTLAALAKRVTERDP